MHKDFASEMSALRPDAQAPISGPYLGMVMEYSIFTFLCEALEPLVPDTEPVGCVRIAPCNREGVLFIQAFELTDICTVTLASAYPIKSTSEHDMSGHSVRGSSKIWPENPSWT